MISSALVLIVLIVLMVLMVLIVLEVLEVLKFLIVQAIYRLLAGSWQKTKYKCLLELLAALTGAVRNLSVLSGGINNLLI